MSLLVATSCARFGFDAPASAPDAAEGRDAGADVVADQRPDNLLPEPAVPTLRGGIVLDIGGTPDDWLRVAQLTTDAAGKVYLVGQCETSSIPDLCVGATDGFLVALDPALGYRWARGFGSSGTDEARALVADAGELMVAGVFEQTIELAGTTLTSAGGDDGFVAVLSGDGLERRGWRFGSTGDDDRGTSMVLSADGSLLAAVSCVGEVDFGGGVLTGAHKEICLVRWDRQGVHLASRRYAGKGDASPQELVEAPDGTIYLTGMFRTGVDLGEGPLTSQGEQDVFVAALTPTGELSWVETLGTAGWDRVHGLARDAMGNVYLSIYTEAAEEYPTHGAKAQLVSFTAAGVHRWSLPVLGDEPVAPSEVLAAPDGAYWVGAFGGGASIGGVELVAAGERDMFIAGISFDDGGVSWAMRVGGDGSDEAHAIARTAAGDLLVGGSATAPLDLGQGELPASRASGLVVFRLSSR